MAQQHNDWADITSLDTFPKVLQHNAKHWPDQVAMREKEFGIWREFTWQDYEDRVKWMALALQDLGVGEQDVVGLLGDNRPEWVWGELAAHAIKGYSLGIYQDSMHEEVAYLINYAKAKVVIAEDEEQCDKLLELGDEIPSVEFIIYCDPRGMRKYDDPRLIDVEKAYKKGQLIDKADPDKYLNMVAATKGSDLSILCTTSGTTSKPKLAQLHSGTFLDHCAAYLRADPRSPGDNYVSVLPLPWIMEQVYVVGQALISRQIVNFVEEQETMMADLREIGPNFVLLAPRVWENIVADVSARMMDSTPFKQKMYKLGMKLANQALDQGKRSKLAEWILLRALRDRLGFSNLTSAATGGAAMGPDTFRYLQAIGVPLKQLYGQTEMCGAYTVHKADDVDYDSVGVAFDNAEVKVINPDSNGVGEIIAKSTGMFTGYLNNQAAYDEDVQDGWMHTGDAGYFKESGHLVVIDRLKDMSETSHGDRYSPQFIENKLKFSPFIAEAVVVGKDRPWLSAIICIRYAIVAKWAEQKGIAFTNYTNLSAQPEVYRAIREEVMKVNESLPDAQKISKFILLYKELDADDGELTRTRKVRRGVVAEKYGDIIETIYSAAPNVDVDTVITYQDGTKTRIQTSLVIETLIQHELTLVDSEQRRIA
ncbi:long-chain fatty acid--CoA ligase [Vibrio natriegens]|uniref:AMP-dependent synthetase n=1 Tax=Vibrio natriegens NBRC 15636 = ATCC 14048 = DSM 759 TaxID=1219067 RepID=A0AAN0Y7M9_VIBNA|nr:long-chain fatty acid--CoA ligase [Vibrio natriegens]ALR18022.1 AMP-dependent synthetase [Vibrio natriegens NBRC 15636 = ATCC 14048 = DSM 759]ANQ15522.1 AMP-dependent synthetase [Vibrio natriegens NBRC 15636 = ATCC 14048 = DSM 759]EPM41490.1 AMP-dependent synthetase [Vibrio natriegens NBRC 15636 = ATCC 14048 = DSM 759]MDX6029114.1 long-chain fatty acid--CoA ligase [Vibrio natriegens NBRC 15636 = ATCC 14048 = DSM 759]UUI14178.1 long-chain fatty acid--CoA ligase [Vibrio natriegens]